jgi:predicted peptidase
LVSSFGRQPKSAVLLAGLHEAKVGDGSGSWNNSNHRDETWWYGLKKKLGEVRPTPYLLDLPQGYDADQTRKWPLLIFLHGSGEGGQDLSKLRHHGPPKLFAQGQQFPFILVSPQAPSGYLLGTQIIEVLDEVASKYRVDASRVYLTGLSMGGNSTWFTSLEFPERFAAIFPIAANGDPGGAARLKEVPTWYFVGGKDTTMSLDRAQQMVEAMTAAGVPFKFTLYPEAGHGETWEKAYNDPALYEWMLAQKRAK